MSKLENHESAQTTKLLFIGNSGAGKSGALASLAAAGYNLRIVDVDNGLDVLANLLRDPKGGYGSEALGRVEYETITDKMKPGPGGKLIPSKATVWTRAMGLMSNWKTETADFGPLESWGTNDILVIDSLTMLSTAALNMILMLNNRLGGRVEQSDWYSAQQLVEGMCQMLYNEAVKCNVIITSHIKFLGPENMEVGYPNTLGKALPPVIGRYFNTTLLAKTTGQGAGQKRRILTRTSGQVELKNTAPLNVKEEYPLETGLADYFRDVRTPPGVSKT